MVKTGELLVEEEVEEVKTADAPLRFANGDELRIKPAAAATTGDDDYDSDDETPAERKKRRDMNLVGLAAVLGLCCTYAWLWHHGQVTTETNNSYVLIAALLGPMLLSNHFDLERQFRRTPSWAVYIVLLAVLVLCAAVLLVHYRVVKPPKWLRWLKV